MIIVIMAILNANCNAHLMLRKKCVAKNTFQLAKENTVKDLSLQPKDHFTIFRPIAEG